jgi:hypothetical protein
MKTLVDLRLRDEARAFGLRFACEDCAHWDGERRACGNGWPDRVERAALLGDQVAFCKEFELGAEGA